MDNFRDLNEFDILCSFKKSAAMRRLHMLTERRNIVKISLIRSLRIADTTFLGFKNAKLSIKNKTILDCAKLLNANANHLTDLSISDEDAVTAIALEPFELYFGVRIHKGTPLLPPPTKE